MLRWDARARLPIDDDGRPARLQRQQIVFRHQAASSQMRLQGDLAHALRRQIGQAARQITRPPARQFLIIRQRCRQRLGRHAQQMLLHHFVEARALPRPRLETQRVLDLQRRVAYPLDEAQLKTAGAIGIIAQAALGEGKIITEAHGPPPSRAHFPRRYAAQPAASLQSRRRARYSR